MRPPTPDSSAICTGVGDGLGKMTLSSSLTTANRSPYPTVHRTFLKLLKMVGLEPVSGRPRPRLHDLRHRFAVRALQACPPGRGAVSQHMLALATYLGHANINNTYWYLEATAELLEGIAAAGEAFYKEVTS